MTTSTDDTRQATTYRVIRFDPLEAAFFPVGAQEASSPEQAVRKLVGQTAPGEYVAVAERNWREVNHAITTPEPQVKTEVHASAVIEGAFARAMKPPTAERVGDPPQTGNEGV